MFKFIGFIAWLGGFIGGVYLMLDYFMNQESIAQLVWVFVLFMLSGIGRRFFHIRQGDINDEGLGACILHRIFCRRFVASIIKYAGMMVAFYALVDIMNTTNLLKTIGIGIAGFVVCGIGSGVAKYTCSHCGHGLYSDDEDYDSEIEVEHSSSSSKAFRYSTEYLHCPRCGHQARIRHKNQIASVKYE